MTVNAAINLYARAKITPRDDNAVIIESQDTQASIKARSLKYLKHTSELELISRLVKFYNPETGLQITTSSDAPAGSGLGGSSALGIAVSGALNHLTGRKYSKREIIHITRDIEGQVIRVPPGNQDYYPAVYGGVNALWMGIGGVRRERLNSDTLKLNKRLILCYTGKTRFSGTNNWQIMKKHIDGNKDTFNALDRIKNTALNMREAVSNNDMGKMGKILKKEWNNRKRLFAGVSNKKIEELILYSMRKGAVSAKVCGAGGGGCILFFVKDGCKNAVADELQRRGGKVIDFTFIKRGLEIRTYV